MTKLEGRIEPIHAFSAKRKKPWFLWPHNPNLKDEKSDLTAWHLKLDTLWSKTFWSPIWFSYPCQSYISHVLKILCLYCDTHNWLRVHQNVKSWFKSWVTSFTFQAYTLPHILNCICVSLFKFLIWILNQFLHCPKGPSLPTHIKVSVSYELCMYIFDPSANAQHKFDV